MTPEPMPTRLRREAARWGDSKLAALLTQAAAQMEVVEREVTEARGLVSWLHEVRCETHPDVVPHRMWGCPDCLHFLRRGLSQAEAQLAASRALLDRVRDYLTREAHPDWTDAARVSMAHAALTGPAATP